jgi:hypothetical protein
MKYESTTCIARLLFDAFKAITYSLSAKEDKQNRVTLRMIIVVFFSLAFVGCSTENETRREDEQIVEIPESSRQVLTRVAYVVQPQKVDSDTVRGIVFKDTTTATENISELEKKYCLVTCKKRKKLILENGFQFLGDKNFPFGLIPFAFITATGLVALPFEILGGEGLSTQYVDLGVVSREMKTERVNERRKTFSNQRTSREIAAGVPVVAKSEVLLVGDDMSSVSCATTDMQGRFVMKYAFPEKIVSPAKARNQALKILQPMISRDEDVSKVLSRVECMKIKECIILFYTDAKSSASGRQGTQDCSEGNVTVTVKGVEVSEDLILRGLRNYREETVAASRNQGPDASGVDRAVVSRQARRDDAKRFPVEKREEDLGSQVDTNGGATGKAAGDTGENEPSVEQTQAYLVTQLNVDPKFSSKTGPDAWERTSPVQCDYDSLSIYVGTSVRYMHYYVDLKYVKAVRAEGSQVVIQSCEGRKGIQSCPGTENGFFENGKFQDQIKIGASSADSAVKASKAILYLLRKTGNTSELENQQREALKSQKVDDFFEQQ